MRFGRYEIAEESTNFITRKLTKDQFRKNCLIGDGDGDGDDNDKSYWYEYQLAVSFLEDIDNIFDFTTTKCITRSDLHNYLKQGIYGNECPENTLLSSQEGYSQEQDLSQMSSQGYSQVSSQDYSQESKIEPTITSSVQHLQGLFPKEDYKAAAAAAAAPAIAAPAAAWGDDAEASRVI